MILQMILQEDIMGELIYIRTWYTWSRKCACLHSARVTEKLKDDPSHKRFSLNAQQVSLG